ncbi:hypothetical protein DL767_002271 [Monosporascus sp. MG133]|nr:hypothetical protein DL767_002271 [Monosporascus sp. MG133]
MKSKGEDTAQSSKVGNVQRHPVVKSIYSENRDAVSPRSLRDARSRPLDPHDDRVAACVVTRRTDRMERAESPPSSSQGRTGFGRGGPRHRGQGGASRATQTAKRLERAKSPPSSSRGRTGLGRRGPRRRGRGGAGSGGGGDGGSDGDKPKRNWSDDDPKPISRPKLPESQPQDLPDRSTSRRYAEEQERPQQLRDLRNVKKNGQPSTSVANTAIKSAREEKRSS